MNLAQRSSKLLGNCSQRCTYVATEGFSSKRSKTRMCTDFRKDPYHFFVHNSSWRETTHVSPERRTLKARYVPMTECPSMMGKNYRDTNEFQRRDVEQRKPDAPGRRGRAPWFYSVMSQSRSIHDGGTTTRTVVASEGREAGIACGRREGASWGDRFPPCREGALSVGTRVCRIYQTVHPCQLHLERKSI